MRINRTTEDRRKKQEKERVRRCDFEVKRRKGAKREQKKLQVKRRCRFKRIKKSAKERHLTNPVKKEKEKNGDFEGE